MSNLANVQRRLAEGTASWLNYEFQCNRGDLFSEKYLALPVGQLLKAALPSAAIERVEAEVNHPVLAAAATGSGRKPQLDFVIQESGKITVAVETKWSSRGDINLGDILWDLVRLELIAHDTGAKCYFVLAGFGKRLDKIFKNPDFIKTNAQQKISSILPIPALPDSRRFRLDDGFFPGRDDLYARMKKYPGVKYPSVVGCTAPHFFPATSINSTFQVYVWSITSSTVRHRFHPS